VIGQAIGGFSPESPITAIADQLTRLRDGEFCMSGSSWVVSARRPSRVQPAGSLRCVVRELVPEVLLVRGPIFFATCAIPVPSVHTMPSGMSTAMCHMPFSVDWAVAVHNSVFTCATAVVRPRLACRANHTARQGVPRGRDAAALTDVGEDLRIYMRQGRPPGPEPPRCKWGCARRYGCACRTRPHRPPGFYCRRGGKLQPDCGNG
jgi:hypothetical protein